MKTLILSSVLGSTRSIGKVAPPLSGKVPGDPDCLGPLIQPRSPRAYPDWAQRRNVRPPSYDKKIGLVLQGGGALGSYQAGVYEALASSEYLPDWVAGISIGAINAAIIVGNMPENRVKRLRSFWERGHRPDQSLAFCADWLTRPSGEKSQVR